MVNAPIRYFGGKGTMLSELLAHFPKEYTTFVDVYGGSGTVLFNKPYCPVEVYNDLELNVYTLYKVIQDGTMFDAFRTKCELSLFSEQLSNEYRDALNRGDDLDDVTRAFYFFYINRTRRSGGEGGMSINTVVRRKISKSTSDFLSAVDRLEDFHQRMSSVIIMNRDALELIPFWDKTSTFLYLDPPYAHSTRTSARYRLDCDEEHHVKLVDVLLSLKQAKVCLSGYDNDTYKRLVEGGWNKSDFDVKTVSGTNKAKTKTESVWKNYTLGD